MLIEPSPMARPSCKYAHSCSFKHKMNGVSGRNSGVGASQHDKQHQNKQLWGSEKEHSNALTFEVPKNFKPNSKFKVSEKDKAN